MATRQSVRLIVGRKSGSLRRHQRHETQGQTRDGPLEYFIVAVVVVVIIEEENPSEEEEDGTKEEGEQKEDDDDDDEKEGGRQISKTCRAHHTHSEDRCGIEKFTDRYRFGVTNDRTRRTTDQNGNRWFSKEEKRPRRRRSVPSTVPSRLRTLLETLPEQFKLIRELPRRALTDDELRIGAARLQIPHFRGVFMMDELARMKSKRPECGIINLDRSDGPGTHWTAYRIRQRCSEAMYYDSFGDLPPPPPIVRYLTPSRGGSSIRYNYDREQNFGSSVCGKRCLEWLVRTIDDDVNEDDDLLE